MPVIIAGNKAQKDKYLTRMIEEPLMCVSIGKLVYNLLDYRYHLYDIHRIDLFGS